MQDADPAADAPESKFVQFMHKTVDYLAETASIFDRSVNLKDEAVVAKFVTTLAKGTAAQAFLPMFAQGTTFASVLRLCNALFAAASAAHDNATTNSILMDLKPVEHKALQSSNKSRKRTYLPSGAPAAHLTVGQMIQAGKRVEEEASRKGAKKRACMIKSIQKSK